MDPIHPITIDAPVPLPIAAPPRIAPAARDGGRNQEDTGGRRRRAPAPARRGQDPETDSPADDGHPHIDVTA
jgi:hypothetical protein